MTVWFQEEGTSHESIEAISWGTSPDLRVSSGDHGDRDLVNAVFPRFFGPARLWTLDCQYSVATVLDANRFRCGSAAASRGGGCDRARRWRAKRARSVFGRGSDGADCLVPDPHRCGGSDRDMVRHTA